MNDHYGMKIADLEDELCIQHNDMEKLEAKLKTANERIEKLRDCLHSLNNIAPPMYKYNQIEFEIITTVRQCLSGDYQ